MVSATRLCIFCLKPGKMTDEHVWGRWLKPYLVGSSNKFSAHNTVLARTGTSKEWVRNRAGIMLQSSVPVVCETCNNGWLSGIQEKGKRHLIPLILGSRKVVDEGAQREIGTWAAMSTMTGEYISRRPETIAVSQSERSLFKETHRPPPGWKVYIGNYAPNVGNSNWVHACMPIYIEGDLLVPNFSTPLVPLPTTQWTTTAISNLFIYTASSSTSPDLIDKWQWDNAPAARHLLIQVWPPRESVIAWPPHSMTHSQAQSFAVAHFNFLRRRARSLGLDA